MTLERCELRVAGGPSADDVKALLRDAGRETLGVEAPGPLGLRVRVGAGDRRRLFSLARERRWDLSLLGEGSRREASGVIAFDCDSTLVLGEGIDDLAARAGVLESVARITREAMAGKLDYAQSLRQRVELLRGLDSSDLEAVARGIRLRDGARDCVEDFRGAGWTTLVVSGGFEFYLREVQKQLGLDEVVGNRLEIVDGTLTGRVVGPIVGASGKAKALQSRLDRLGVTDSIGVGDGANDLQLLTLAKTAVGMQSKPVLDASLDVQLGSGSFRSLSWLCALDERSS